MNTLKLGLCFLDDENNVVVKRTIGTTWHLDADDIAREFKIHVYDEIARVLYDNLKLELTEETILSMIKELHKDV